MLWFSSCLFVPKQLNFIFSPTGWGVMVFIAEHTLTRLCSSNCISFSYNHRHYRGRHFLKITIQTLCLYLDFIFFQKSFWTRSRARVNYVSPSCASAGSNLYLKFWYFSSWIFGTNFDFFLNGALKYYWSWFLQFGGSSEDLVSEVHWILLYANFCMLTWLTAWVMKTFKLENIYFKEKISIYYFARL